MLNASDFGLSIAGQLPGASQPAPTAPASILSEKAMLSRLTIRQWSARRLDRKITDQVNAEHGAASDAGRYNKLLISSGALGAIQKAANAAREEHYKRTLPWDDDGARLLSAAAYLEYSAAMLAHRQAFESAVAEFVTAYPELRIDARARLNGMFDESDYPAAEDIRARFFFGTSQSPCPTAGDFRVDVGEAAAAAIRADIESRSREALAAATREVWQRVADHVGHMADRLRAYEPGKGAGERAKNVFRDSLVENVRELASLLPGLNVTGDPILARIGDRMMADLCRDDADALRENATARESVAAAAESIMADVGAYLS